MVPVPSPEVEKAFDTVKKLIKENSEKYAIDKINQALYLLKNGIPSSFAVCCNSTYGYTWMDDCRDEKINTDEFPHNMNGNIIILLLHGFIYEAEILIHHIYLCDKTNLSEDNYHIDWIDIGDDFVISDYDGVESAITDMSEYNYENHEPGNCYKYDVGWVSYTEFLCIKPEEITI